MPNVTFLDSDDDELMPPRAMAVIPGPGDVVSIEKQVPGNPVLVERRYKVVRREVSFVQYGPFTEAWVVYTEAA